MNEIYDKEIAKELLTHTKRQLEISRINERYYQRVLIVGINKMASTLLSQEQIKIKSHKEFIEFLEEIIKE